MLGIFSRLLAPLACAALLPAQDLRWKLPADAAVLYTQKIDEQGTLERSGRPKQSWSIPRTDQMPPLFFEAELDPKRTHLDLPIYSLGELPMHLAVDLRFSREAGKRILDVPGSYQWRAFKLEVRYAAMAADGTQRITARSLADPNPAGTDPLLELQLVMKRKFDLNQQRVSSFEVDGSWTWRRRDAHPALGKSRRREWYSFDRLAGHGDVGFNKEVDAAVAKGLASLVQDMAKPLKKRISQLGPRRKGADDTRWYGPGYRALVTLTMIKAGLPRDHPTLLAALEELRRLKITETYSLATALMAMEAYYAPEGEGKALLSGKLKRPKKRRLPGRDRAVVQRWTDRLLRNHDVEVDPAYLLRFRYHRAGGFDNSATQYAMLGLYSARLCGARISPQVWYATANHWLQEVGEPEGPPFPVQVTGPGSLARAKSSRTVARLPAVQPCGWGYRRNEQLRASMVAAGITGLKISLSTLQELRRAPRKLQQQIGTRIRGGMAWLAQNFSMRVVTGMPMRWTADRYYNWYSIERAMALNQVETLQGRDWYFEGARILLGLQNRRGTWNRVDQTCFAILFLKKAVSGPVAPIVTAPITPGKRRRGSKR